MADRKIMRDIGLNDKVSVELPAYVWLGFAASYISSSFNSPDANEVVTAVQRALLDPLYLKEQEAHHQQQHDQAQSFFNTIVSGNPPEVPPNMEEQQ